MDRVRADKLREVTDGHDGTWVAHPALIPIAKQVRPRCTPVPCPCLFPRQDRGAGGGEPDAGADAFGAAAQHAPGR